MVAIIKNILIAIAVWSVAAQSWAAITIDATASAESSPATSTTITYNHTIAGDANGVLIGLCERDTNASNFTADTSTVTVGGASATQLNAVQTSDNLIRMALFHKVAPSTGVVSIVANADTGTDRFIVASISLKGIAPSAAFNTSATASNTGSANADITGLASAVNELGVMAGCIRTSASTPSPDAGAPVSTEQVDAAHTDGTSLRVFLYTEAGATTSIDMLVDLSASERWAAAAVSVRPGLTGRHREVLWLP